MSNTLRLEDDAIEKCVGVCDTMLEQIDDAIKKARALSNVSGFGGFQSARELQSGYLTKFTGGGGSGSVVERLSQFRYAIEGMRAAFSSGGESFAETDSLIGQALASLQESADK
ncbi:hypothetical protein L1080_030080 [Rhodococcus sp. MSC1_016]|jgi:hypothetical protein|uniref:hypothetical protein n=1 Tax=Rhodococcus sp. MSC1_016 TaxID=2909266 RepID=UPI00202DCAF6|nr:hypothetical protein [Rhodococcus sp. MSC1_016]